MTKEGLVEEIEEMRKRLDGELEEASKGRMEEVRRVREEGGRLVEKEREEVVRLREEVEREREEKDRGKLTRALIRGGEGPLCVCSLTFFRISLYRFSPCQSCRCRRHPYASHQPTSSRLLRIAVVQALRGSHQEVRASCSNVSLLIALLTKQR
jgi:hypothetical protein